MAKRRSYKQILRDYKAVAPPAPKKPETDHGPIERTMPLNNHDKAALRRAAEKERLRALVREALEKERGAE